MHKKKRAILIFIGAATILPLSLVSLSCSSSEVNKNTKIVFDEKIFDNQEEAIEYAKNIATSTKKELPSQNVWQTSINNEIENFNNPYLLKENLNNKELLKTIKTKSSYNLSDVQLNPADGSILDTYLEKLNIDAEYSKGRDSKIVFTYRGSGNSIFETTPFTSYEVSIYEKYKNLDLNVNKNVITKEELNILENIKSKIQEAQNKAKSTYLTFNKVYYFNDIYFRSIEELRQYIVQNESDLARKLNGSNNYENYAIIKSLTDPNSFQTIKRNNGNEKVEKQKLKNFLMANSKRFLKYKYINTNKEEKYLYLDMTLEGDEIFNALKGQISDNTTLKEELLAGSYYQRIPENSNGESSYVVGSSKEDDYNLTGPKFLQTSNFIDNFANSTSWIKTPYAEIPNEEKSETSQDILINSAMPFFDYFLLKEYKYNLEKNTIENLGILKNFNSYYENFSKSENEDLKNNFIEEASKNSLFTFYKNDFNLLLLEQKMFYQLSEHTLNSSTVLLNDDDSEKSWNLLNEFNTIFFQLTKMKILTSFDLVPVIYNWILANIVRYKAKAEVMIAVRNFFEEMAKKLNLIIKGFIPNDFLTANNNSNQTFDLVNFWSINNEFKLNINHNYFGEQLLKSYPNLFLSMYALSYGLSASLSGIDIEWLKEYDKIESSFVKEFSGKYEIKENYTAKRDSAIHSGYVKIASLINTNSDDNKYLKEDYLLKIKSIFNITKFFGERKDISGKNKYIEALFENSNNKNKIDSVSQYILSNGNFSDEKDNEYQALLKFLKPTWESIYNRKLEDFKQNYQNIKLALNNIGNYSDIENLTSQQFLFEEYLEKGYKLDELKKIISDDENIFDSNGDDPLEAFRFTYKTVQSFSKYSDHLYGYSNVIRTH